MLSEASSYTVLRVVAPALSPGGDICRLSQVSRLQGRLSQETKTKPVSMPGRAGEGSNLQQGQTEVIGVGGGTGYEDYNSRPFHKTAKIPLKTPPPCSGDRNSILFSLYILHTGLAYCL